MLFWDFSKNCFSHADQHCKIPKKVWLILSMKKLGQQNVAMKTVLLS